MESLAAKVAFLASPAAYGAGRGPIVCRETHMSWVFLVGESVYKLKKPVRFPYLDFSTLAQRRAACFAELTLNRRLAGDVYAAVRPLVRRGAALAIGGDGEVVDWLVVMRRLDESRTLERLLLERRLAPGDLRPLAAALVRFYRAAPAAAADAERHLARWRRRLDENRRGLLDRRLGLPAGRVHRLLCRQQQFLRRHGGRLADRVRQHRVVDGHGDLRPEHVWPLAPVRIIDCLEFSAELRAVDPLDELAYLHLECSRLGARRHGDWLVGHVVRQLAGGGCPVLFAFYASYRAALRARLAIAHLLEPAPRTPAKWRPLALAYLDLADRATAALPA